MHYLAATASVHATAAICDYLDERATADDAVTVVGVAPPDDPTARRDAKEALNVAPVRLATVGDVRTDRYEGDDPVESFLETATEIGADEIVLTSDGAGDVRVRAVLEAASLPVVVVPEAEF